MADAYADGLVWKKRRYESDQISTGIDHFLRRVTGSVPVGDVGDFPADFCGFFAEARFGRVERGCGKVQHCEPLKALRQGQGLSVAMVDVEDIYDEFSFGDKTPQAVKDFVAYAATSWKKKPRYVPERLLR